MTPYGRFNRRLLTLIASMYLLAACANYVVDPHAVFGTNYLPQNLVAGNIRFLKVEYLNHHRDRFDSYILGSSRVGVIHPKSLERYLPGSRFYNLTVAAGTQYDNWQHMKYLVSQGDDVKHVLIQIDFDFLETTHDGTNYGLWLHPDVLGKSVALFYATHLTVLPTDPFWNKIQHRAKGLGRSPITLDRETGMLVFWKDEEAIAKDPARYITRVPDFHAKPTRKSYADTGDNIHALKKLKNLCDAHNIRCMFFTTPLHWSAMDSLNPRNYLESLREIGLITEFYAFSGYNSVTLDNYLYYEGSHYRPSVGEMIVDRILAGADSRAPSDFGVLVTGSTLDAHIERAKQNLDDRDRRRQVVPQGSD